MSLTSSKTGVSSARTSAGGVGTSGGMPRSGMLCTLNTYRLPSAPAVSTNSSSHEAAAPAIAPLSPSCMPPRQGSARTSLARLMCTDPSSCPVSSRAPEREILLVVTGDGCFVLQPRGSDSARGPHSNLTRFNCAPPNVISKPPSLAYERVRTSQGSSSTSTGTTTTFSSSSAGISPSAAGAAAGAAAASGGGGGLRYSSCRFHSERCVTAHFVTASVNSYEMAVSTSPVGADTSNTPPFVVPIKRRCESGCHVSVLTPAPPSATRANPMGE
mmetsp:Transcript_3960/g.10073  ORF Transcript_3960/g.10073 Transcript_3960/m.10073 type:complete len:272 (+) Transcript_3960:1271-2086(+)